MRKITYVKQTDLKDCGVACLMSLIKYYGGYAQREYLRELTKTTKDGVSAYSLIEASQVLGFEAKALKGDIKNIKMEVPFIAHLILNNLGHFVVVIKVTDKDITIMDPSSGIKKISFQKWQNLTTNVYLLFKPKTKIIKQDKEQKFIDIFLPILKKYRIVVIILFIFSIIYTLANVLLSYQFQFFLDLVNEKNFKSMYLIFVFLFIIIILKEITNLFRNYLINYVNHTLDKTLLKETYNHIIKLPYLFFKNRTKGDIVTRIQDVFTIREVISKLFVTLLIDVVLIIILFIAIVKLNKKLAFITLITTIFYIIIIYLYNSLITKKMKNLKESESLVNNHIIETFDCINTVKGMQIENKLSDKLLFNYREYQNTSFSLYKNFYQENFFKNLIYSLGLLLIIYLGIKEVALDNFSLGSLLVFNSILIYYFEPIQNICNLQILIKEANVSFSRLKELFNIHEEKDNLTKKSINKHLLGNIKFQKLRYSYTGIKDIVKCDNLEIKSGHKVLLYGNSGEGKSTLMKILVKFLDDYKGDIYLEERELHDYEIKDIRKRITYISQEEVLYTDTLYQNIVLDNEISYEEYKNIIKITGVEEIIKKWFLKDEMILENNGSILSGGEKQKVILARSLVRKSDIYIFDESFSAIDLKGERYILKNVFEYLKKKTVIVISHRFNNRDLYDQFILINKGVVYEY